MKTNIIHNLSYLLLAFFLIGCSNTKNLDVSKSTAKLIYEKAIASANNKQFEDANEAFESILLDYPYSVWATKSKVMMAWVYYESNKYDSAINMADNFIKNHPENELVPYALYLKAMSYYERIFDVERDTIMTENAKEAFENLINKFPNSEFARESKLKIELARSNLAGKQMSIGRYYQKQGHFAAAIKRFQKVITEFETTDQTPEALLRLTECYLSLGTINEAIRTASVLKYNFPDSTWSDKIPTILLNELNAK